MEFFVKEEVGWFFTCIPGLLVWIMSQTTYTYEVCVWVAEPTPLGHTLLDTVYGSREECVLVVTDLLIEMQWTTPGII